MGDTGEAIAKRFTDEGGIVVGLDRRPHSIGDLALVEDLTDEAAIEAAYAKVAARFGRLDVLYNNAGPVDPEDHSALDTSLDAWNRVIASILTATWLSCKHAIPHMGKGATAGSVINTASFLAGMGSATGQMAFNAAKAGVEQLSRDLGVHLARSNVRVNAIAVGPIGTAQIKATFERIEPEQIARRFVHMPMGRFGTLDELAATAAYLASDDSKSTALRAWGFESPSRTKPTAWPRQRTLPPSAEPDRPASARTRRSATPPPPTPSHIPANRGPGTSPA